MAKKKPKAKEDTYREGLLEVSAPPKRPPGRAPKPATSLQGCLADLWDHTEAWIRRSNRVWFTGMPDLTHALEEGTPTYEGVVEQYEKAIDSLERLARKVKNDIAGLEKGKAVAEKRWADQKKSRGQRKSKPASNPPSDEKEYFGPEGGGS